MRLPHPRGGEPKYASLVLNEALVFPTRVGVNLVVPAGGLNGVGLPHPRGGEPRWDMVSSRVSMSSPPAWG